MHPCTNGYDRWVGLTDSRDLWPSKHGYNGVVARSVRQRPRAGAVVGGGGGARYARAVNTFDTWAA